MRVMQGLIEYRELGDEYQHALSFYSGTADIWAAGVPQQRSAVLYETRVELEPCGQSLEMERTFDIYVEHWSPC